MMKTVLHQHSSHKVSQISSKKQADAPDHSTMIPTAPYNSNFCTVNPHRWCQMAASRHLYIHVTLTLRMSGDAGYTRNPSTPASDHNETANADRSTQAAAVAAAQVSSFPVCRRLSECPQSRGWSDAKQDTRRNSETSNYRWLDDPEGAVRWSRGRRARSYRIYHAHA